MKKVYTIKGYTLIELVISLAVMSVMASIVIAGYANFTQRQKIMAAGKNVMAFIKDAENRVYTGEIDCSVCGGCDDPVTKNYNFIGWYLILSHDPDPGYTAESMSGACNDRNNPTFFSETRFSLNKEGDDHVRITSNAPGNIILFKYLPERIIQIEQYPNGGLTVCVTRDDYDSQNKYYKISVTKNGVVSSNDSLDQQCP